MTRTVTRPISSKQKSDRTTARTKPVRPAGKTARRANPLAELVPVVKRSSPNVPKSVSSQQQNAVKPSHPAPASSATSPPTVPAPAPAGHVDEARRKSIEHQAAVAKVAIIPVAMAMAIGDGHRIEASGYRLYLNCLLKDAGNPTDPVEIMLLEQLAVCHFRAAQLHGDAGQAEGMEAIEVFNAAAARCTAEVRKIALTLKEYRGR